MSTPTVYIKQSEGIATPITVRIHWLANGDWYPTLFWMPNGICYEVSLPILERAPLSCLKEKGVGTRITANVNMAEDSGESTNLCKGGQSVHIYFADSKFDAKCIVDAAYNHNKKLYISVEVDIFSEGSYELVGITVDSDKYLVSRTLSVEPRGSYGAGGVGICHKLRVVKEGQQGDCPLPWREANVYLEFDRWFIHIGSSSERKDEVKSRPAM